MDILPLGHLNLELDLNQHDQAAQHALEENANFAIVLYHLTDGWLGPRRRAMLFHPLIRDGCGITEDPLTSK